MSNEKTFFNSLLVGIGDSKIKIRLLKTGYAVLLTSLIFIADVHASQRRKDIIDKNLEKMMKKASLFCRGVVHK